MTKPELAECVRYIRERITSLKKDVKSRTKLEQQWRHAGIASQAEAHKRLLRLNLIELETLKLILEHLNK